MFLHLHWTRFFLSCNSSDNSATFKVRDYAFDSVIHIHNISLMVMNAVHLNLHFAHRLLVTPCSGGSLSLSPWTVANGPAHFLLTIYDAMRSIPRKGINVHGVYTFMEKNLHCALLFSGNTSILGTNVVQLPEKIPYCSVTQ